MYATVTCEDGKKTIVNIDKIKCIIPIKTGGSCLDFGNSDYFNCKEEYENIFDNVVEIYSDELKGA